MKLGTLAAAPSSIDGDRAPRRRAASLRTVLGRAARAARTSSPWTTHAAAPSRRRTSSARPSRDPRQVFAIGLNYAPHAAEAGYTPPDAAAGLHEVPVLHRRPGRRRSRCPDGQRRLGGRGRRRGRPRWPPDPAESEAWSALAGLTLGQDLSERVAQLAGRPAQFSLGKSFPGFGPTGPWIVTPDEFADPDDIALLVDASDGEALQSGRTSDMIFSIPPLVAPPVGGLRAAARRPDLHRHPGGHRQPAGPAPLPPARRDPRLAGRGDRHDHPEVHRDDHPPRPRLPALRDRRRPRAHRPRHHVDVLRPARPHRRPGHPRARRPRRRTRRARPAGGQPLRRAGLRRAHRRVVPDGQGRPPRRRPRAWAASRSRSWAAPTPRSTATSPTAPTSPTCSTTAPCCTRATRSSCRTGRCRPSPSPIDGPWLKLSEAVDYVRAVRPETVLPIHEGELTDPAKYVGMLNAFT